jgi:hypothetical protein
MTTILGKAIQQDGTSGHRAGSRQRSLPWGVGRLLRHKALERQQQGRKDSGIAVQLCQRGTGGL